MFLSSLNITPQSVVSDIVTKDYRTADVFKKYSIEYCCGGKWSLETICLMKGIDFEELEKELRKSTRRLELPAFLVFQDWSIDFLTDYIINIHHCYLKTTLPVLGEQLERFVEEHANKNPGLSGLKTHFIKLHKGMLPHLQEEEDCIFPYLKQVAHAYDNKDSYAPLLIKTLRKPIEKIIDREHEIVSGNLSQLRTLTNNYTPPEKACTNHRVTFSKLKELDNDLVQHIYLENNVLFPRVLAMEKELLGRTG